MHFHPINTFWLKSAQGQWPRDRDGNVFLARAACTIGAALFPRTWSDSDFTNLGAPDPGTQTVAGDAVERFLATQEYSRAVHAHTAGQRAGAVATLMLTAAEDRTLVLVSRHIRAGGNWCPVLHLDIDESRSAHIFISCSFNPAEPFNASSRVLERHHLFVTETSLARVLRSVNGPKVPPATLLGWARDHTPKMSQRDMIVAARSAFPGHAPPTEDAVKAADAQARADLDLPARTRGKPRRGGNA